MNPQQGKSSRCWSNSPQSRTHYYLNSWRSFICVREHRWQSEKACRDIRCRCAVKTWYQDWIRPCTLGWQQDMPVGYWIDFSQSKVQLPMNLSMARVNRFMLHQESQQRRSKIASMFVLQKSWRARHLCAYRCKIPRSNEDSKRRSRLVAREFTFAEGKRDYIFSPATSGHVLKLLPTIFLQRVSAFSRALGCLGVKDAFLQVPQEKPLKVNLRGEEFRAERNLPGQRVGAKAWCVSFTEHLTEELRARKKWEEYHLWPMWMTWFSQEVQIISMKSLFQRCKANLIPVWARSKTERIGGEFNFLRRTYKIEVVGRWTQPGNYIQQMLKAYQEQIGVVKLQQLPADNSI